MAQFRGAQIVNPDTAGTSALAAAWAPDWGYRIARDTSHQMKLVTVGPASTAGGVIIPPDIATKWDVDTQNAMLATGLSSGAVVSASTSTVFAVYYCSAGDFAGGLGFSTTAPTSVNGVLSLGAGAIPALCRFLGWMYLDAAGDIQDDAQHRHVVNYYNRLATFVEVNPGYTNDNARTTYARNVATWTSLAATAANSTITFVGNGEDAAAFALTVSISVLSAGLTAQCGIGLSGTQPLAVGSFPSTAQNNITSGCTYNYLPASGTLASVQALIVTGANLAIVADWERQGAAADPPASVLRGWIMA